MGREQALSWRGGEKKREGEFSSVGGEGNSQHEYEIPERKRFMPQSGAGRRGRRSLSDPGPEEKSPSGPANSDGSERESLSASAEKKRREKL